ncbi:Asp23/Gls24 family envelope stress response protein [Hathewaya histolytica]|uniref:Alkaline shock protein n=1 Tax=Hathewaya histolytica TaxID=1498 RepID=A0A4U9R9R2_HATHI|nr:Asp23/Gls24 family envelope stress response protein [Hathewaya histolytica]VTQ88159.1 alkaline shock protein [Hathewaya histolytica]
MSENIYNDEEKGIVKISDEVVGVIAGLAAAEIKGIVGMSSGIVGGFTEILSGKKNFSKGVRVNLAEDNSSIDLFVVVEYGIKIHEVAKSAQENVKKAVESMTGLQVDSVNVFVQNVELPKREEELLEE